jgi:hypothetical protein
MKELTVYIVLAPMLDDQYVTLLLINGMKAMEALIAKQKKRYPATRMPTSSAPGRIYRGHGELPRNRFIWVPGLNDGTTAHGVATDSDRTTSQRP